MQGPSKQKHNPHFTSISTIIRALGVVPNILLDAESHIFSRFRITMLR